MVQRVSDAQQLNALRGRRRGDARAAAAHDAAHRDAAAPVSDARQDDGDAEACWADVPPEVGAPHPRRARPACRKPPRSSRARRAATSRRRRARRTWRCSSCAASRRRRPPSSPSCARYPKALRRCAAMRGTTPRLRGLMELFASEDSRIGLPEPGEVADTQRVDLLLHRGEAVGYAWSEEGSVRFRRVPPLPAAGVPAQRGAPRRALPRVVARRVRAQDPRLWRDAAERAHAAAAARDGVRRDEPALRLRGGDRALPRARLMR